jgi:hypothetical protein
LKPLLLESSICTEPYAIVKITHGEQGEIFSIPYENGAVKLYSLGRPSFSVHKYVPFSLRPSFNGHTSVPGEILKNAALLSEIARQSIRGVGYQRRVLDPIDWILNRKTTENLILIFILKNIYH